MDNEKEHTEFVEDLVLNLIDVLSRHEEYYKVALGIDTAIDLGDGRILTLTVTQDNYGWQ